MSDFKAEKMRNIERHEKNLEKYEDRAETLAQERERLDRGLEVVKSILKDVRDDSDNKEMERILKRHHEEYSARLDRNLEEHVTKPIERINEELSEELRELSTVEENEREKISRTTGEYISDEAKAEIRNALEKSANEYNEMAREADALRGKGHEIISDAIRRISSNFK